MFVLNVNFSCMNLALIYQKKSLILFTRNILLFLVVSPLKLEIFFVVLCRFASSKRFSFKCSQCQLDIPYALLTSTQAEDHMMVENQISLHINHPFIHLTFMSRTFTMFALPVLNQWRVSSVFVFVARCCCTNHALNCPIRLNTFYTHYTL